MDQAFIDKMKAELKAQRTEILESLAEQSDDMRDLIKTVESGDEADVASDAIDRNLLNAFGAQDAQRLMAINNALDRINLGKYGRCTGCGNEIAEARLEAIPYAPLCINCASAGQRKYR